jgi:hypothetical protein
MEPFLNIYVGFYTSKPFWVDKKIKSHKDKEKLWKEMSEDVCIYDEKNYKIKVSRDGMILLKLKTKEGNLFTRESDNSIKESERNYLELWKVYLPYLNTIYLLLDSLSIINLKSAYFSLSEISHKDAFRVFCEYDEFRGFSSSSESYSSIYQNRRFHRDINDPIDFKLEFQPIIPKKLFNELFSIFNKLYYKPNAVDILSELVKSIGEYNLGNYSTSLVLSWFIIESFVKEQWNSLLDSKNMIYEHEKKRISKKRKDYFNGRDYSMSIITNILELFNEIDYEIFEMIDFVRNKRNKIVHRTSKCNSSDCEKAFYIVKKFIMKNMELDLDFSLHKHSQML